MGVSALLSSRDTSTTDTAVTLICLMEDYIRPDEQFQWFREDTVISEALSNRYSIQYVNGFVTAQVGQGTLSFSRFTVLMISEPAVSDAGIYTCEVNGTLQSATVAVTVNDPNGEQYIY